VPLGIVASDFMIASVFLLTPHNQTITAGLGTFDVALDELAALMRETKGRPDPAAVAELRRRYDIEQLTALRNPASVTR